MRPRLRSLAFALLLLALPLAAASGFPPPAGAQRLQLGPSELAYWVSAADEEPFTSARESLAPGEQAVLWFGLPNPGGNDTHVAYVNLSGSAFAPSNVTVEIDPRTSLVYAYANTTFTARPEPGDFEYNFTVELYARDAEGNLTQLGNATGLGGIAVQEVEAPVPPPGIPGSWLVAGLAVLVVGGGAAAYAARQRAIRRRMKGAPRSQVMREMELEQKLERAKAKDPEAAVVIQKEIRQAEQVREKRRELQILEAKRADALKTLDLLKKRHEAGGLTKLQYDNMAAKKRQDLARIEAEIAQMEGRDPGAAA